MKKLIVCLAILVVASYAQAAQNVLIGSWEDSTNEGWYDFPTAAAGDYNPDNTLAWVDDTTHPLLGVQYFFDDGWYTDGWQSLKVQMAPASEGNGWGNKMIVSVKNDWFDNSILSFDVSAQGWAQIVAINLNAQTENFFGAMVGGWSEPVWTSGTDPQHYEFNYSAFKGGVYSNPTDGWINICFQVQGDTDAMLLMDNVRLDIPEPATIALLGLGGLALLRRKK